MTRRRFNIIEIAFVLVVLAALAVLHFSQIPSQRRTTLALKIGLQQLLLLEDAHFAVHGQYFDPSEIQEAMGWSWMRSHQWRYELYGSSFSVGVHADMNGDGQQRWWWINSGDRLTLRLPEDRGKRW